MYNWVLPLHPSFIPVSNEELTSSQVYREAQIQLQASLIEVFAVFQQAVEAALLQLPMVNACSVVAHGEEGEDKYLVAYVVPEGKVKKNTSASVPIAEEDNYV